jgi:hypothetical protein
VPAKEKQEVLEAFAGHKADVTTGFFTANNLAAPEFGCPFRP